MTGTTGCYWEVALEGVAPVHHWGSIGRLHLDHVRERGGAEWLSCLDKDTF